MEIKKFWNKLKYWQNGCIIGFLYGLIIIVCLQLIHGTFGLDIDISGLSAYIIFLHFIPIMLHTLLFDLSFNTISIYSFIFVLIWYALLGVFLGFVYQILKKLFTRHLTLYFIISLVVFMVLIWILNFYIFVSIVSKIGT